MPWTHLSLQVFYVKSLPTKDSQDKYVTKIRKGVLGNWRRNTIHAIRRQKTLRSVI